MERIIVSIECASWFEREDGLIQIINKYGNNVILNRTDSVIWNAIEYDVMENELVEKLKGKIEKKSILEVLDKLEKSNLVSRRTDDLNMEMLFG